MGDCGRRTSLDGESRKGGTEAEIGRLKERIATLEREKREAQRELHQQQHLVQQVVNTSPSLIYIYDLAEQRNVYSNDGVERLLGFSPAQIQEYGSELFANIIAPESMAAIGEHQAKLAQANDGDVLEIEYDMKHVSGQWRTFHSWESIFARHDDGKPKQTVGVAVDFSALRAAEQEREEALEELARSNRDLEQFAYVVSHDLKEPLRMIAGFTDLLARRYGPRLDEKANEYIGFAVDGAKRMEQLIADLLTYSRVSHGGELVAVAIDEVLAEVRQGLAMQIEERGAEIVADPLPSVLADRSQVFQVLQNLVGNALKFCGDVAPKIHITAEERGAHWVLGVGDNGIGIAPEHVEQIFKVFRRLHPQGQYAGTGVGLAIVKRVIERHGGEIWVESAPGEGSTFYFSLPTVS